MKVCAAAGGAVGGGAVSAAESLEASLLERLDALGREGRRRSGGGGGGGGGGVDAAATSSSGRAAAAGDEEKVEVLSSVFDDIIGRSKTYGHLLATIKRHYEDILSSQRGAGRRNDQEPPTTPPPTRGDISSGGGGGGGGGGDHNRGGRGDDAFWKSKLDSYAARLSAAEARAASEATEAKVGSCELRNPLNPWL